MTQHQLGDLLTRAGDALEPVDLADIAWTGARRVRVRRRLLSAGAVGVIAAAGIGFAALSPDTGGGASVAASATHGSSPTGSSSADATLHTTMGIAIVRGISLAELQSRQVVARFPADLRVPARLETLSSVVAAAADRSDLRVLAVSIRDPEAKRQEPIFLLQGSATGPLWTTLGTALAVPDEANGVGLVGARAISPDGRIVVLAQPKGVLVVDVTSGSSRSVSLPVGQSLPAGAHFDEAGFTDEGMIIAPTSAGASWQARPDASVLEPAPAGASPDHWALDGGAEQRIQVVRRDPGQARTVDAERAWSFELFGPSASDGTWVVRGGFPDQRHWPRSETPPVSALLATTTAGASPAMLIMDEHADGIMKGGLVALGFIPGRDDPTVVFRYHSPKGIALGAWNLRTHELSLVGVGSADAIWLGQS